ncbi:photosynthetic complex putative assembly protein PuhB [Roseicella sp. DB1501]|uniref:photosynthetic complex putative assembly protein PuhB n=1 Tax=Roseicella sp. DB1501 TaxID=2730925 RepID=UPI001491DF1D|nr:PH domain-containing protein [Roseicella sp. DB1501]
MREHEHEPVIGLPEALPAGETVLWQGAPGWTGLAFHTFRLGWLAAYFAAIAAWGAAVALQEGASPGAAAAAMAWPLALGAAALGLVTGFAILAARTTLYTITNRRLVLRVGVALPTTVNIPFASIRDAGLRPWRGGGDIRLALLPPHRASYVGLWPHLRGFRLAQPQPVLRALPDAEAAGRILARALAMHAALPVPGRVRPAVAPAPVGATGAAAA